MNITQKELEAIVEVGQSIETPEIRMNIVNIIGDIRLVIFILSPLLRKSFISTVKVM